MPENNLLEEAGIPQLKHREGIRVVTPEIRAISKKLDFDYYDGDRKFGFGGYYYDGRWKNVADATQKKYKLNSKSKVLIERDEKGFLTHDLLELIPGITLYGTHCSNYPIHHAMDGFGKYLLKTKKVSKEEAEEVEKQKRETIIPLLLKVDNRNLPFRDNYFDTVISLNSICNHPEKECRQAVREIVRVSKHNGKNCYINTDSWRNNQQKSKLMDWVLICETFLDDKGWKRLYYEEGYQGYWGFVIFD